MGDPKSAEPLVRNETLDGLKYVAAALIVLHHVSAAAQGSRLGQFLYYSAVTSLFFFFAVSGYLHGPLGVRGAEWRLKRVLRLGVPYLAWSAFFLLWGQRAVLHGGAPFVPNPLKVIFFAGADGILWFLPVLLVCALLADTVVRNTLSRRVAIAACVAVTLWLYWSGVAAAAPPAWQNFVLSPRYLLVYLAGMEMRASAPQRVVPSLVMAVAAVAVIGVGMVRVEIGHFSDAMASTMATLLWDVGALAVLLGAVRGMRWFGAARLAWGRDYLIGVYLSHVVWLVVFVSVLPPSAMDLVLWIPLAWVTVFGAASATTWALLSNRFTRPLVL